MLRELEDSGQFEFVTAAQNCLSDGLPLQALRFLEAFRREFKGIVERRTTKVKIRW